MEKSLVNDWNSFNQPDVLDFVDYEGLVLQWCVLNDIDAPRFTFTGADDNDDGHPYHGDLEMMFSRNSTSSQCYRIGASGPSIQELKRKLSRRLYKKMQEPLDEKPKPASAQD